MKTTEALLFSMGGKAKNQGFQHIVRVLDIAEQNPDAMNESFREIYKQVAAETGKTVASVERAIVHEVKRMYAAGGTRPELLDPPAGQDSLTAKEFLFRVHALTAG